MQIAPIQKILPPPPPENTTKLAINNTTHETIFLALYCGSQIAKPQSLSRKWTTTKKPWQIIKTKLKDTNNIKNMFPIHRHMQVTYCGSEILGTKNCKFGDPVPSAHKNDWSIGIRITLKWYT